MCAITPSYFILDMIQVPAGLMPGQQFVVNVPQRGSQMVTVSPGMRPGATLQLQYPGPLAELLYEAPTITQQAQSGVISMSALALSNPQLPKLASVFRPLADWPYSPNIVKQQNLARIQLRWHNRPSPVANDNAGEVALANWHPAAAWANKKMALEKMWHPAAVLANTLLADEKLAGNGEERQDQQASSVKSNRMHVPLANSIPLVTQSQVRRLKDELAAKMADVRAEERKEGQLARRTKEYKSKLAVEKGRLLRAWREGEKELGGRQEEERQVHRLRMAVQSSKQKVSSLETQLHSSHDDIRLLHKQLASSKSTIAASVGAEKDSMEAGLGVETIEVKHLKEELVSNRAALAVASAAANKLPVTQNELRQRENDELRMEHNQAVQTVQLRNAKQATWKMAYQPKKDQGVRQAVLQLQHEVTEIQTLKAKLRTVKSEKSLPRLILEKEERAEQLDRREVEDLKGKLENLTAAAHRKAVACFLRTSELAKEVSALKSRAGSVDKAQLEINTLKNELKSAREKAADEPLLQKEVEKDDRSMRTLWQKLSTASAKLHATDAHEEKRAQLAREVDQLKAAAEGARRDAGKKAQLEHHHDDAIQNLQHQLVLKNAELNEANRKADDNAKREAKAADAKVQVFESELRNGVDTLEHTNAKLHAVENHALQNETEAIALAKHDCVLAKKNAALEKQILDLKSAEEAAERAKRTAEEQASNAHKEVAGDVETRDLVTTNDATLQSDVKQDTRRIGTLQGKLEIAVDEQSILQQKLVDEETKLIMVRDGNHTKLNQLQGKLEDADTKIRALNSALQQKNGDLVVAQSEVDNEKDAGWGAASMQAGEVATLRENMHTTQARDEKLSKDFARERDERHVAETKTRDLQRMVKQDALAMSTAKASLWGSEAQVDTLQKRLRAVQSR